jgi:hypothetical protein
MIQIFVIHPNLRAVNLSFTQFNETFLKNSDIESIL